MRVACPHCGERGLEEFTVMGAADRVRPGADASLDDWHEYVHLRANPRGVHREHWHHLYGCRRWLVVTRDTLTHEILSAADVAA